jgi:hypothetical protein
MKLKLLVRHFFTGLFDLGFLSETGTSSLPRTIATTAGVLFAVGLILARVFLQRYALMNGATSSALYNQAVLTDHVFLIAVPMWIVAFVTVLVGPSLFPDETDFRVLTAMPVSRRLIFGAKLSALVLFIGVFMLMAQAASLPVFTLTAIGPWAIHSFPLVLVAFLLAGALGSVFAALAITAIHATLLLLVPRQHLLPVSAAAGSILLFLLVIAVPLVGHVPSFESAFASGSRWLMAFPPAWFVGLERWFLGEARFGWLALLAIAGLAAVGLLAAGAYLFLYRHFDRVMMRPASDSAGIGSIAPTATLKPHKRPARTAVRVFTMLTLRRSVLHQGILVAVAAFGAALVANSLLGIDLKTALAHSDWRRNELIAGAVWAPFVLIFVTSLAVRSSLLVPIEGRANWVFRMTEQPATRADELEGASWVVRLVGVAMPVAIAFPLQWIAVGPGAVAASAVALAAGALLVEVMLFSWRKVPFTCSYLVGKGFVPLVLLKGTLAFVGFTSIGGGFAGLTLTSPPAFTITLLVLLSAVALLVRHVRLRQSAWEPLEFEDVLPTETNPLRLSPY